jgi:hypothetical protein
MPTSPLAKTKSPHGSNGPEDNNQVEMDNPGHQEEKVELAADCEKSPTPESEQPDAVVAVDSGDTVVSVMSESDRKLATKMTRAISDHLGLSGRSRSVKM